MRRHERCRGSTDFEWVNLFQLNIWTTFLFQETTAARTVCNFSPKTVTVAQQQYSGISNGETQINSIAIRAQANE